MSLLTEQEIEDLYYTELDRRKARMGKSCSWFAGFVRHSPLPTS